MERKKSHRTKVFYFSVGQRTWIEKKVNKNRVIVDFSVGSSVCAYAIIKVSDAWKQSFCGKSRVQQNTNRTKSNHYSFFVSPEKWWRLHSLMHRNRERYTNRSLIDADTHSVHSTYQQTETNRYHARIHLQILSFPVFNRKMRQNWIFRLFVPMQESKCYILHVLSRWLFSAIFSSEITGAHVSIVEIERMKKKTAKKKIEYKTPSQAWASASAATFEILKCQCPHSCTPNE